MRNWIWILLCFFLSDVHSADSVNPCEYTSSTSPAETVLACFDHDQARGMRPLWLSTQKDSDWMKRGLNAVSKSVANRLAKGDGPARSKQLLHVMRVINELHNDPHEIRFPILNELGFMDLCELIVRWRVPLYTSSYNEIVRRILVKLKQDTGGLSPRLLAMKPEYQAIFLESAGSYGRLGDFMEVWPEPITRSLLLNYLRIGFEAESIRDVIVLAEALLEPNLDSKIRDDILKERYQSLKLRLRGAPGLAKHPMHDPKLALNLILLDSFLQYAPRELKAGSRDLLYTVEWHLKHLGWQRLKRSRTFDALSLLGEDRAIHQKHIYFDDADGRATFDVFTRKYKNVLGWNRVDGPGYARISQMNPFSGIKVDMLLNRPEAFPEGSARVDEVFASENLDPHMFVFRGHSYHVSESVDHILEGTRLVLLGSCGGVENLDRILRIAPKADIILTRGTGTVWVNNVLMRILNEKLLSADVLSYAQLRSNVRELLVTRLEGYAVKEKVLKVFDEFYLFPNEHPAQSMMKLWLKWYPEN